MSIVKSEIVSGTDAAIESLNFVATVIVPAGVPVPDVRLAFQIDGDGGFEPSGEVKQIHRLTDTNGEAFVTWFAPPDSPDRETRSALSVIADCGDATLRLERYGVMTGDELWPATHVEGADIY